MKNRKLGRDSAHRKALLRNQATSLIEHGKLETTEMKAKELSAVVDKLVTLAKKNNLHARRLALNHVYDKVIDKENNQTIIQKLFDEIGPKYMDRQGGYTRVIKTTSRRGDNAPVAIIEFV